MNINNISRFLFKLWRKIPLLGGLADVRAKDHYQALLELSIVVATSTVPVWIGSLIMLTNKNNELRWIELIIDNVYNGELFLYSTALLGPLYYFLFSESRVSGSFPNIHSIVILSTLGFVVSIALFAAQRAQVIYSGVANLDKPFIFSLSWKIYLGAVLIVYLSYVYRNFRETGAPSLSAEGERAFVKAFRDR